MNLKRRILTMASIMLLSITMTAGITLAQDNEDSDGSTITFTMPCITNGNTNTPPSTVSLSANGSVNFETVDLAESTDPQSTRTGAKAIRVTMSINSCLKSQWHVDATILNFTSGSDIIPGTKFQLPIGAETSSPNAMRAGDVPVTNVVGPTSSVVTFGGSEPFTSSHAIAHAQSEATGEMYMDFTGELANLDPSTATGTYESQIAVTFTPSAP